MKVIKNLLILTSLLISGSLWAEDEFPPCEINAFERVACSLIMVDSKYIGEWQNGKLHGQGTYYFSDGSVYVGEFKNGMENGYGTYTYTNGEVDKYVGQFKDRKWHGLGTQYSTNGYTIQGEWIDGLIEGDALCKEKDKPIFACSYVNSKTVPTSRKADPDSFLYGIFKSALSGVVQGAIVGAINGECEMSTTSKTRQVIPGSPQYGQKTTTRTTSKNCNPPLYQNYNSSYYSNAKNKKAPTKK